MKPIDGLKGLVEVTKKSAYAPASEGPFRCDHCEHFKAPSTCNQPDLVKIHGSTVEPGACCNWFEKDS